MKRKFINVITKVNSEFVDVLSVSHADMERLMAILQLAPVGSVVEISINEEEVQAPSFAISTPSKDA